MPRKYKGPSLWFDRKRGTWTIRDGRKLYRTGCRDDASAQRALEEYSKMMPAAIHPFRELKYQKVAKRIRQQGVYIIGYGEYIKIGISRDIGARIATIQIGFPEKLHLYAVLDGWVREERQLHRRFSKYSTNGEWFKVEGELAEWLKRLPSDYQRPISDIAA